MHDIEKLVRSQSFAYDFYKIRTHSTNSTIVLPFPFFPSQLPAGMKVRYKKGERARAEVISNEIDSMKIDFSVRLNLKRASIWLRVESSFPIRTSTTARALYQTENHLKNELFQLASLILWTNMAMTMPFPSRHGATIPRCMFFDENYRCLWYHHFNRLSLSVRVCVYCPKTVAVHDILFKKLYSNGVCARKREREHWMWKILIAFLQILVNIGKALKSIATNESIFTQAFNSLSKFPTYFTLLIISLRLIIRPCYAADVLVHCCSLASRLPSNSVPCKLFRPERYRIARSICRCNIKICSHVWLSQYQQTHSTSIGTTEKT